MSEGKGFIAVYTWAVEPAHEAAFREAWHEITLRARGHGALGSSLGRDAEGHFVAIALWPDEATRTQAFAHMTGLPRLTAATRIAAITMVVEDDLWLSSPFALLTQQASSGEA